MFKFSLLAMLLASGIICTACGGEEEKSESAIRLPEREVTWVRKQEVKKTSDAAIAGDQQSSSEIPINDALAKKLQQAASAGETGAIKDLASCLSHVKRFDTIRTAVQKGGGMWHAFERNPKTKTYSNNGMQLDSQTNKMVFALKHLCKTAKGKPMDPMEQWVDQNLKTIGEEAAMEKFSDVANKGDAETWVKHVEQARKDQTRTVDYKRIEQLINRTAPLINLYEELSKRPVEDAAVNAFLSDSVTLLNGVNQFITGDKVMIMALTEEDSVPFYNLESEM